MATPIHNVPWANLWRWVVSSLLFFFVFAFILILAILADILQEGEVQPVVQVLVILASMILGAVVVWSDDIPWPGDA